MVTQRYADFEDAPELIVSYARNASAAIGSAGNLVEVAPDRAQLADGLL
jgi:hypothetical protein